MACNDNNKLYSCLSELLLCLYIAKAYLKPLYVIKINDLVEYREKIIVTLDLWRMCQVLDFNKLTEVVILWYGGLKVAISLFKSSRSRNK